MWANFKYFSVFLSAFLSDSASPFSGVQRGRAAGASVSTAEQQLAVQRQTKSQCCPSVLLLVAEGCILPCQYYI